MKAVIVTILTLCLCVCASSAWAQEGADPEEATIGLDIFYPGMSQADAQTLGAVPSGENTMKGKVTWGDQQWIASMGFKNNELSVLSLVTKMTDNNLLYGLLQAMDERLYVPFFIDRKTKDESSQTQLFELLAKGKSEDELNDLMTNALSAYAGQEDGSLTVMFCPQDMRSSLAEIVKAGKDDEKVIMDSFGDSMIYTLNMKKSNDMVRVMVATLANLGIFAGK